MNNIKIEEDEGYTHVKKFLQENDDYSYLIKQIGKNHSFMYDFSFLQSGRDLLISLDPSITKKTSKKTFVVFPNLVLNSSVITLHSILICSEYGHFADVMTLIRKYRDDLFFYLYLKVSDESCDLLNIEKDERSSLVVSDESCDLLNKGPYSKTEINIKNWNTNSLSNLNISKILEYIGKYPGIKSAVEKYHLKSKFTEIGNRLNNYVHGNGPAFYNRYPGIYTKEEIKSFADVAANNLNYITVVFVFLLAVCHPISIASTDYEDCMNNGGMPLEGSQFCVAPFVEAYLKNYACLLGDDCISFLKERTRMEI